MPASDRKYQRRWLTLAVLGLSLLIVGLDNTILNVALLSLQREFNASASALQWMVDSYVVVFAGMLLTMGALGDRFGRARALTLGLLAFGGASAAAAAFSTSEPQLIAARAVMGVGGALIMPATLFDHHRCIPSRRTRPGDRDLGCDRGTRHRRRPDGRGSAS